MVLNEAQYKDFEAVVGPSNISTNKAILETYTYNWCVEFLNEIEGKEPIPFYITPAAVILPGSTEEVVQIVKLCNKHGLQFKAQSTGLGPWNQPSSEKSIVLDMRRMNKIVKIDEKNLYAVVEPYVTGAQLQAELLKHGLNCHMPGAGPQVSPLASATSMCGPGFTSSNTGFSGRNVLGTEWVLPTGEVLQIGSLGLTDDPDWFHGDGPGPSLRGIMRGFTGTKSGLGVFTRVAIRLFPFPCEPTIFNKIKGTIPKYDLESIELMRYHIFSLRDYDEVEKALLRIAEEEIAFMVFHASNFALMCLFSPTKEEMLQKISIYSRIKNPVLVMIVARTQREFDYKEKALAAIVEELGLKDVTALAGRKKFTPPKISYAEALRSALGMHGFLATGAFQSTHGAMDTINFCKHIMQANIPLKRKYIKKGVLADDRGEGVWTESFEHGHFFHAEMPTMYDQTDRESIKGMAEYLMECNQLDLEERLGIPFFIEGDEMHDWYGPQCSNYHLWLRKIKAMFDPNAVADSGFYISAKK